MTELPKINQPIENPKSMLLKTLIENPHHFGMCGVDSLCDEAMDELGIGGIRIPPTEEKNVNMAVSNQPNHWLQIMFYSGFPENSNDNGSVITHYPKSKFTKEQFLKWVKDSWDDMGHVARGLCTFENLN